MNQYRVLQSPAGPTVGVKVGWSWPAFIFGVWWALAKRLWAVGLGTIAAYIGLVIVVTLLGNQLASSGVDSGSLSSLDGALWLVGIIIHFFFGANGNAWKVKSFVSRGYDDVDVVSASNPEGAVAIFLKSASSARSNA